VESGLTADILSRPSDPYTRSLIDAVPELAGELWQR
jgi:ABC-type oligopeptide transport system ATPase subunit